MSQGCARVGLVGGANGGGKGGAKDGGMMDGGQGKEGARWIGEEETNGLCSPC